jgi:hypothetical protein
MSLAIVVLKVTLVPLLIGAITLAGRKWGPTVAGWLSGMPIVAGPIMFFIATEQGAPFANRATVGMLLGVFAVLSFNLGYSWASTRFSWRGSLVCGVSMYFSAIALLDTLAISLNVAAALVLAILIAAPRLFPSAQARRAVAPANGRSGEIVVRMIAGAVLVVAVTFFAATFGAHLSGLFATFPVISMVLAVFSHRQSGAEFAIRLLRGIVFGWYAFLIFGFVLGRALPSLGTGWAFVVAIVCTAMTQLVSRQLLRREHLAAR